MAAELVKSVASLLAEKEAVQEKEKDLIKDLNGLLSKMGYQIIPLRDGTVRGPGRRRRRRGPGRPRRRRGRPRGRRRGRPPGRRARRGPGRPPGSGTAARRGRPPKTATE